MEKEKERVSKQKKMLQLKEHVARKKEMKKESNKMAYTAWQKNKKMKALAQKKKNKEDELIRAQEEAAVEALIRQKKEQKKRARLKQQQLLDKQLLLSMNDFAVSQEKQAMENLEKKKIKTMKKKLTALLKTPYTDKMTKSLLRGKTPNGVHTRETMAPQWLMTSKMAAHYDIASDPNSSSSLHSGDKLPHLKATPDVPNVPNVPNVAKVPCEFVSVVSVFSLLLFSLLQNNNTSRI